jgi:hypothetical protein
MSFRSPILTLAAGVPVVRKSLSLAPATFRQPVHRAHGN